MPDQMKDLAMNARAWTMAERALERAGELRIATRILGNGARVMDMGIAVPGGLGAGRLLAGLCLGGLGEVDFAPLTIGNEEWPGVQVWTDHPAAACMASQYAGWAVDPPGYFAMGSGPVRAKARVERELFERLGYREDASQCVVVLETRTPPSEESAGWIAARAGISPAGLTIAVAPTASLAGGVQIAARTVETGLHKMDTLGFDVGRVVSAVGTCPLPLPARDDLRAIGRTNDCILYGGRARYVVRAGDDELAQLVEQMPACASRDYGTPFYDVFRRYDGDFYKIDPRLFSPAEVWLTGASSGRTFHAGRLDPDVLKASLFGA